MKKLLCVLMSVMILAVGLTGCSKDNREMTADNTPAQSADEVKGADSSNFDSSKTISVISREDGSGTRGAFIELFGIEKKMTMVKKWIIPQKRQLSPTILQS